MNLMEDVEGVAETKFLIYKVNVSILSVKIMSSEHLKLHAHLQIIEKRSAYQVRPTMNIEGVVGTKFKSACAETPSKIVKSKF